MRAICKYFLVLIPAKIEDDAFIVLIIKKLIIKTIRA